jgi:hypothetical protein
MLYIGMDCSIKNLALVEPTTGLATHYATGLSLKSTPSEYLARAYECSKVLNLYRTPYIILVDFTMYQMKARQSQMRLNSLLIGAVLAYCNPFVVRLVEPKHVRQALGLKANASKSTVYEIFDELYPMYKVHQYTNDHIQDALVLSVLGKESLI